MGVAAAHQLEVPFSEVRLRVQKDGAERWEVVRVADKDDLVMMEEEDAEENAEDKDCC